MKLCVVTQSSLLPIVPYLPCASTCDVRVTLVSAVATATEP